MANEENQIKIRAIVTLIAAVIVLLLTIFLLIDYFKLRKTGDEMARRLGYDKNWREVVK